MIADAGTNFAAYAPDVPGCIGTSETNDEVTTTLRAAIGEHLEILREMGEGIPTPRSRAGVIQIASWPSWPSPPLPLGKQSANNLSPGGDDGRDGRDGRRPTSPPSE